MMLRRAKRSLAKQTPTVRFLWVFNTIALTLLFLWLVLGNFIAWQQETPFLQAREALVRQYPIPTNQQTAKSVSSIKQRFTALEQETRKNCGDYWVAILREQFDRVIDDNKPLPRCFQTTLSTQSANLEALVNYLLSHPIPLRYYEADDPSKHYIDLNKLFAHPVTYASPGGVSALGQQNFLLLHGLRKSQLGQPQAAFDAFAAAWKLNQALLDSPGFINQLVHITNTKHQAGLLRRVNGLPANWQAQFPESDRRTPFFKSLEIEIFKNAEIIRTYPTKKTTLLTDVDSHPQRSVSLLSRLLTALQQPYFTLSAVDYGQKARQANAAILHHQDLCDPDSEESDRNLRASVALWNIFGRYPSKLDYIYIWRKLGKAQLNWELTEKVLLVKEQVAQTGKFPAPTPAMAASSVCPSQRWRYQVAANGKTAKIELDHPPQWLMPSSKSDIPLAYTISLSKVLGQK